MAQTSCTRGWGHARFLSKTKFKIQVLSPTFPFFEEGFYEPEAERQVCFCSHFVTLLVDIVTSKCKKKKLQELETDYAFGISLPIHQQLTRSCFNFCCFTHALVPKHSQILAAPRKDTS